MERTDQYSGLVAETIGISGHNGDTIRAYLAKPTGPGPFPGVVLIHHAPGWDEWYLEATRRFAHHGYLAICAEPLPARRPRHARGRRARWCARPAACPTPRWSATSRARCGWLRAQPVHNGKVGVIGTCSGGRHTYLVACQSEGVDAAVDCWGGGVVMAPDQLNENRPVAPIDMTADLSCPLLGLFGNDDRSPTPEQVDQHEAELKRLGKTYEFHRYDGAGHGFFYYTGHVPAGAGGRRLEQGLGFLRPPPQLLNAGNARTRRGSEPCARTSSSAPRSRAPGRARPGWFDAHRGERHVRPPVQRGVRARAEHRLRERSTRPGRARRGRAVAGGRAAAGRDDPRDARRAARSTRPP